MLFIPLLCFGIDQPSISKISSQQTKTVGENVKFECTVENMREFMVFWIKKGNDPAHNQFISAGPSLLVPDNRYIVTYTRLSDTEYTFLNKLEINDLTESDSGTYQCVAKFSVINRLSSDVELTVQPTSA